MADLVTIGKIIKPFGVKGQLRVQPLSDVPGRFEGLEEVTLESPSGETVTAAVTGIRSHQGTYLVEVDACSTPEEAGAFRGGWLKIPPRSVPALPEGHYYEFELIGLNVRDDTGRFLGILEDILETGSNPVFVVRQNGREELIPGTRRAIASVDLSNRTMTVRRVEGLLDE